MSYMYFLSSFHLKYLYYLCISNFQGVAISVAYFSETLNRPLSPSIQLLPIYITEITVVWQIILISASKVFVLSLYFQLSRDRCFCGIFFWDSEPAFISFNLIVANLLHATTNADAHLGPREPRHALPRCDYAKSLQTSFHDWWPPPPRYWRTKRYRSIRFAAKLLT